MSANIPRISIVVAAYNVAPYLPRCVESLLGQTEESLEVILVDDGSTDETPTLADSYALNDPRVKVIHRPNGGLSAARNTGLSAAIGEFVCFMDSDDWAEKNMLTSMMASCERTGSTVAIAGVYVDYHDVDNTLIRSDRRVLPHHVIRRGFPLEAGICDENFVNLLGYAWNKIYRRDWLSELGIQFEEGLKLIEDIEFNAKVLSVAEQVVLVPDAFVHYIQRPRKSLGNTHDETLLRLRLRSIECVDSILDSWRVDQNKRTQRSSNAGAMALWIALRTAAESPKPKDQLRRMIEQPGVNRLMAIAKRRTPADWRGCWAAGTLTRRWYGVALLPMKANRTRNKWVSRFSGRTPS